MRFLAFIIAVMTTFASFGLESTDSVNVCFRVGHRHFDPSLGNNRKVMDSFIKNVREAVAAGDIERIVVRGFASPDGDPAANERLARNRCISIADYIAARADVNPAIIEKQPAGIAWGELRSLVAANPDVPCRQKVLDILDNTPVLIFNAKGAPIDGRKKRLMDLDGGRPYNWMYAHLFPQIRNAVAISLYRRPTPPAEVTEKPAEAATDSIATLAKIAKEAEADSIANVANEAEVDTLANVANLANITEATEAPEALAPETIDPIHRFAVKTNMLYYPILLPNVELEWLINDRWSVAVEGNIAWWGSYKKERSYRLAVFDAEVRRWLLTRKPWHGLYVGFIAGGGYYDFEKGSPGKYGDGLMTGLSVGYMWPIGRNLSLEAELGGGYVYTRYKEYQPIDGHHVYLRTKDLNYFGPIKLKFSIAWRFFEIDSHKRIKSSSL